METKSESGHGRQMRALGPLGLDLSPVAQILNVPSARAQEAGRWALGRLLRRLSRSELQARWKEDGAAVVLTNGQGQYRFHDVAGLARFLCQSVAGAEDHVEAVAEELHQSLLQECLALAYLINCWQPFAGGFEATEEQVLLWEQFAAFAGHPTHVMAKARRPLSLEQALLYAPEFAPKVQLRLVAVDPALVRVWPSADAWQALLAPLDLDSGYLAVPVHPLNEARLRQICHKDFAAGRMHFLEATVESRPTLSLRTVVPLEERLRGLRIKLPVPLVATSLPRYVSPVEVWGSVLISRALRRLRLPSQLAVQMEEHGLHLRFGENTGYTYEEARYFAAILRQSPAALAGSASRLVPLAAAFATNPRTGPLSGREGPCLWRQIWSAVPCGRAWFSVYTRTILDAQLGLFLRYGLALEAHQQNTFLELSSDEPRLLRLVVQELGGGAFWDPQRLAHLEVDFRAEVYERDDVLVPYEKCLACVRHTLLHMHLLPLLKEVAGCFNIPREVLREDLADLIEATQVHQDEGDSLAPADFARYVADAKSALSKRSGPKKALLRMRLLQTKSEIYVEAADDVDSGDSMSEQ
ncbi:unnamed protein product [Effrenium voratum]|nr:unnamed protein product [Effrenium voratum]